jgi:hypothetical protein
VEEILTDEYWVKEILGKGDTERFKLTQVTSKDVAIAYLENKQPNVILFVISLSGKGLEAVK